MLGKLFRGLREEEKVRGVTTTIYGKRDTNHENRHSTGSRRANSILTSTACRPILRLPQRPLTDMALGPTTEPVRVSRAKYTHVPLGLSSTQGLNKKQRIPFPSTTKQAWIVS
ncbi:unnamed protein product, partial [Ectocarpus sp. 12 AP-2014]